MSALDYRFLGEGFSLRLTGQCRAGWTEGQFGPFYRGVCTFDWKFGHRCRAEVSVYPQTPSCALDVVEAMSWSDRNDSEFVSWNLADGTVTVELPIVITQPDVKLHPSWRSTGERKATIADTRWASIGGHRLKLNLGACAAERIRVDFREFQGCSTPSVIADRRSWGNVAS